MGNMYAFIVQARSRWGMATLDSTYMLDGMHKALHQSLGLTLIEAGVSAGGLLFGNAT